MPVSLKGSTSGDVTLTAPAVAGTTTITLPATTGDAVVDVATQTLTNKTINASQLVNASISAAKLDGAQSGSAPIYAARAWVNFNGTGTVAILQSGNVTSITDGGTGVYSVNFTTSMPSANYACNVTPDNFGVNIPLAFSSVARGNTTALAKIGTSSNTGTSTDCSQVNVTVTV